MNNSKKRVGKVVAIAMASAMAMSSLSAALVTASAYEDPALTSSGSVGTLSDRDADALFGTTDNSLKLINDAKAQGPKDAVAAKFSINFADADGLKDGDTLTIGDKKVTVTDKTDFTQNSLPTEVTFGEETFKVTVNGTTKTQVDFEQKTPGAYTVEAEKIAAEISYGPAVASVSQSLVNKTADGVTEVTAVKASFSIDFGSTNVNSGENLTIGTGSDKKEVPGKSQTLENSDLDGLNNQTVTLDSQTYKMSVSNTTVTFTQEDAATYDVDTQKSTIANEILNNTSAISDGLISETRAGVTGVTPVQAEFTMEFNGVVQAGDTLSIGNKKVTITDNLAKNLLALDGEDVTLDGQLFTMSISTGTVVTFTQKTATTYTVAANNIVNSITVGQPSTALSDGDLFEITNGEAAKAATSGGIDETNGYAFPSEATILSGLTYTDSDGRKISLKDLEDTSIKYSVSSGDKILDFKDGTGANAGKTVIVPKTGKDGSGTIQMKVTGKLDLGGDKGTKKITFTHNMDFDVYKEGQIGVEAYQTLNDNLDMKDLAAYYNKGGDIIVSAVTYKSGANVWDAMSEAVNVDSTATDKTKVKSVKYYAGTNPDLFDLEAVAGKTTTEKWEKGSSKAIEVKTSGDSSIKLATNGETGNGSIKATVTFGSGSEDFTIDVTVKKAVDMGNVDTTITKEGSKTVISNATSNELKNKNIANHEIRNVDNFTMEKGTVGKVSATGAIKINGGTAGEIDGNNSLTAVVTVGEDATVGNITDAASVSVEGEGASVGDIKDSGDVSISEDATVSSIDTNGPVKIEAGTVKGDVKSNSKVEITSDKQDDGDTALDVNIGGSIIVNAPFNKGDHKSDNNAYVSVDNQSEDGEAEININGGIITRFSKGDTSTDDGIELGSVDTTGPIMVGGTVQSEKLTLSGKGLVKLSGVKAGQEIDFGDDDGEIINSTIVFDAFNNSLPTVADFKAVKVESGTVTLGEVLNVGDLNVESDAQAVIAGATVAENLTGTGEIITNAGKLVVSGDVEDGMTLNFLDDVTTNGMVLFTGSSGLVDSFDLGGIEVKRGPKKTGSVYDYAVTKTELSRLTAVGKDLSVGVSQQKQVQVIADTAIPEGAKVVWESDDEDTATVTAGEGNTAVITGMDTGSTSITATLVDANGREMDADVATFNVDVLDHDTMDSTQGSLALDTAEKSLTVGQVYGFMVKGNNDVENIKVTVSDPEVAKVELANGTDARGAIYNITGLKAGTTNISVSYKGTASTIKLTVGDFGMTLDTANYTMPHGGAYDVGVKILKNGTQLTGAEVKQMIASGELNVSMSRGGAVASFSVLDNGNIRVMGKNVNGRSVDGTEWLMVKVMKDGKEVNHSSIGITVKAGATAGGTAVRNTSIW